MNRPYRHPAPMPEQQQQTFHAKAMKFIATMKASGSDPCVWIETDQPEWASWEAYLLERYGKLPGLMREAKSGTRKGFTFPTKWPEWFDSEWARGKAA